MSQAIIFDVEATDKNDAVIIEAASLDVTSLNPFEVGNPWVQRYNPVSYTHLTLPTNREV